ncbi:MAG: hypothetical protein JXA57_13375 [Armatimonadetes bacterium]|nr:hypothetical protein [Armatimonadota bacterium]
MTGDTQRRAGSEVVSQNEIVAFVGPLGAGKTEIAINYAVASASSGRSTCLIDLDIVTPYFRVGDYRAELSKSGLRVVAPPGSLANFETPALSPEIAGALAESGLHSVLDVGGDAHGARLLGTYAPHILRRSHDIWIVVNPFRQGSSLADLVDQRASVERTVGLSFTGIVANPHCGVATEPSHLKSGWEAIQEWALSLDLPIVCFSVMEHLVDETPEVDVPKLLLSPHVRLPWETT